MGEELDEMKRVHGELVTAYGVLSALYPLRVQVSMDTAMAIGEATGILSRARALLGRDIDDRGGR